MVEPQNMPDTVKSFIDVLRLNPDALVTVNTASHGAGESFLSLYFSTYLFVIFVICDMLKY